MTTYNCPVCVLGANSRLARAFSRHVSGVLPLRKIARSAPQSGPEEDAIYGDFRSLGPKAFEGCRTVINFVGVTSGPLDEVNVDMPAAAARAAREAGIYHFVQISSLSVYGGAEEISFGLEPAPVSPYGASKLRADRALLEIAGGDLGLTILRAPTFYGAAGGGGKIALLARFMARAGFFLAPRPLPRRSVLHVENGAAALLHIVREGPMGLRFAADHEPFDLAALARAVESAHGRKVRLFSVPAGVLARLKRLAPGLYDSLFRSSLIVPNDLITNEISLPVTLENGLKALVADLALNGAAK